MFEKIKEVTAHLMRIDESKIQMESHLREDLGFDSLMILELVLELESTFDIAIDDHEVATFFHVEDVVTCVEAKINP